MTISLEQHLKKIKEAESKIREFIPPTLTTYSHRFSKKFNKEIYIKWENKLPTGSFKERGAANFLLSLSPTERKKGVCAVSAGNHAMAVARIAKKLKIKATIIMPKTAPLVKLERTKSYGADVISYGNTFDQAREYTLEFATKNNLTLVPPYNNLNIIYGQGTIGIELASQLPEIDSVIVPVGGGGLISGIALSLSALNPDIKIIGVRSQWAEKNINNNKTNIALQPISIADGIGVKKIGEIPKQILDNFPISFVTIDEDTIAEAILQFLSKEKSVMEGAGAACLGPLLIDQLPKKCHNIVLIASGSNIDFNRLSRIIDRHLRKEEKLVRLKVAVADSPGSLAFITSILAEEGSNILETYHNRFYAKDPGLVEIIFLLEVQNKEHTTRLIKKIRDKQIYCELLE